jgi:hypothetical protein
MIKNFHTLPVLDGAILVIDRRDLVAKRGLRCRHISHLQHAMAASAGDRHGCGNKHAGQDKARGGLAKASHSGTCLLKNRFPKYSASQQRFFITRFTPHTPVPRGPPNLPRSRSPAAEFLRALCDSSWILTTRVGLTLLRPFGYHGYNPGRAAGDRTADRRV